MNESRDPWREYLRRRNLALFAFSLTLVLLARVVDAQGKTPAGRRGPKETMCGLGTYHDALDLAFNNANIGAGETLVMLCVRWQRTQPHNEFQRIAKHSESP